MRTAIDCDINFLDTAETYGDGYSEEMVGKALAEVRPKAIIASKVSTDHLKPCNVRTACEASLTRLCTEYIDVNCIHWPNWNNPIADTLSALERLKQGRNIRIIGCSSFGKLDLMELQRLGHVEVNQLPYNLLWRAIEFEILPFCIENQVSIASYSALCTDY